MKLKALVVLFIILISLLPLFNINKYLQKSIRPGESLGKLLLYLLAGFVLIFVYTFLLVVTIKRLFPDA